MTQIDAATKRETLTAVLTASWHALQSYAYGNSSPDLAIEAVEAIERAARILGVKIEGAKREQPDRPSPPHRA